MAVPVAVTVLRSVLKMHFVWKIRKTVLKSLWILPDVMGLPVVDVKKSAGRTFLF